MTFNWGDTGWGGSGDCTVNWVYDLTGELAEEARAVQRQVGELHISTHHLIGDFYVRYMTW